MTNLSNKCTCRGVHGSYHILSIQNFNCVSHVELTPNVRAQPRASARRLQRAVGRATGIERPGCKHHLPVCTLRFLATLSWERNDRAETCPVKFRAIRPNELGKRELAGAMPGSQPLDLPLVPKR